MRRDLFHLERVASLPFWGTEYQAQPMEYERKESEPEEIQDAEDDEVGLRSRVVQEKERVPGTARYRCTHERGQEVEGHQYRVDHDDADKHPLEDERRFEYDGLFSCEHVRARDQQSAHDDGEESDAQDRIGELQEPALMLVHFSVPHGGEVECDGKGGRSDAERHADLLDEEEE